MHELIRDITLSILFAWVLGLLAHFFRQPLILAYLIAGFLIGPFGTGLVKSQVQWSKLGSYERIMMNETDVVLAVSDIDAGKLRGRHVDPQLVPNGVDTSAIPFKEPSNSASGILLFVGIGSRWGEAASMRCIFALPAR